MGSRAGAVHRGLGVWGSSMPRAGPRTGMACARGGWAWCGHTSSTSCTWLSEPPQPRARASATVPPHAPKFLPWQPEPSPQEPVWTTHSKAHSWKVSGCLPLPLLVVALAWPMAQNLHLSTGLGLVWVSQQHLSWSNCPSRQNSHPKQLEGAQPTRMAPNVFAEPWPAGGGSSQALGPGISVPGDVLPHPPSARAEHPGVGTAAGARHSHGAQG